MNTQPVINLTDADSTLNMTSPVELGFDVAVQLRNIARERIDARTTRLVLDMSRVLVFDDAAIASLIGLQRECRERRVKLQLLNPPLRLRRIMEMTHGHPLFEVTEKNPPAGSRGTAPVETLLASRAFESRTEANRV